MHSYHYEVAEDEMVNIHHNGDYSGDVVIIHSFENRSTEMRIPCEALLGFVAEYIRSERISKLEDASVYSLLEGGLPRE